VQIRLAGKRGIRLRDSTGGREAEALGRMVGIVARGKRWGGLLLWFVVLSL